MIAIYLGLVIIIALPNLMFLPRIFLYCKDVVLLEIGDDSFLISRGLHNYTFDISSVEDVSFRKDKNNRYYGDFHEVVVNKVNGESYSFIFTTRLDFGIIPITYKYPQKNRAFNELMNFLEFSDVPINQA